MFPIQTILKPFINEIDPCCNEPEHLQAVSHSSVPQYHVRCFLGHTRNLLISQIQFIKSTTFSSSDHPSLEADRISHASFDSVFTAANFTHGYQVNRQIGHWTDSHCACISQLLLRSVKLAFIASAVIFLPDTSRLIIICSYISGCPISSKLANHLPYTLNPVSLSL